MKFQLSHPCGVWLRLGHGGAFALPCRIPVVGVVARRA